MTIHSAIPALMTTMDDDVDDDDDDNDDETDKIDGGDDDNNDSDDGEPDPKMQQGPQPLPPSAGGANVFTSNY